MRRCASPCLDRRFLSIVAPPGVSGSAMSSISLGAPFRIGPALSRAFSIFSADVGKFVALSLMAWAPFLLAEFAGLIGRTPVEGDSLATILFPAFLGIALVMVLSAVSHAVCLYGAYQVMRERQFSVGESLRAGLARTGPVIGASLLAGLAVMIALLLLIVPGIIVMCMIYVALPACVIEKLGPVASLTRSRALTKGYRWQLFGLLLIVTIATSIVTYGIRYVLGQTLGLAPTQLVTFGWQVIANAFGAVLVAVVYHDLRVAREGVDIEKLANVFD